MGKPVGAPRRLMDGTVVEFPRGEKEITLSREKIVEAISLGGYEQLTGALLEDDENGKIVKACALGMGMLNLGVDPASFPDAFSETEWQELTVLNDRTKKTPRQIAKMLKAWWKGRLKESVTLRAYPYAEFSNYQGVKIK